MRYLVRRGAYAMFMLLGVSLLSFCLLQAAPGDYFDSLLLNPRVSRETLATLRVRAGTASPVLVRYGHWLASIVRGNWGYSLAYNMPAANILWPRAANTLLLTTISTFLAWLLALLLGTASSTWQGPLPDGIFKALMAASLAVPDVVLALVLLLFAVRSGMFPVGGISTSARSYELSSQVATNFTHLVLPVVCLVTSSLPLLLAHVRSAVSEALQQPFVVAARSYGLRPTRLMLRHVLPAAANPLISLLGLSLGALLNSSLIIEVIFSWPGLGQLLLEAIMQRDIYLVVDATALAAVLLLLGTFVADLILIICDPRIGGRSSPRRLLSARLRR